MGKKRNKKKQKELEQLEGDVLPDREVMSIVTTGTGPAPVDGIDGVVPGPGGGSWIPTGSTSRTPTPRQPPQQDVSQSDYAES